MMVVNMDMFYNISPLIGNNNKILGSILLYYRPVILLSWPCVGYQSNENIWLFLDPIDLYLYDRFDRLVYFRNSIRQHHFSWLVVVRVFMTAQHDSAINSIYIL